jgi:hydroxyethylthiazole kinase-like uncharacterized protein yjeF
LKVFTSSQIRDCDAFTIKGEGITSADLMERAARRCYEWIAANYPISTPLLVICGMGNNGGDGLALTRILLQEGFVARAVILKHKEQFSPDASHHLTLLHQVAPEQVQILEPGMFVTELPEDILLVDALFGTGLNRPLEDWSADFIRELNELPNEKIAIDMPSGLPADNLPGATAIVKVQHTLSFQFYKRSVLHPEAGGYTGKVHILDIGLSDTFISNTHSQYQVIDEGMIRDIYRPRNPHGHKGTYGKAILIGGSYGKIGAIALSTRAALRSGAGLVYTIAPECGYHILQVLAPEAMFLVSGRKHITGIPEEAAGGTIGIGPGLGQGKETARAVLHFLEEATKAMVIDADALNIIAGNDALHMIPRDSVLSPHPKEFDRLFGESRDSMLRVELARAKAMKYNIYIVLKGHFTTVLGPSGECWYNMTGNAGMATGGSGDVLTGMITGLLAQGYGSRDAALMGVYLHGMAGDIAAAKRSQEALVAGDIIESMGKAFLRINS